MIRYNLRCENGHEFEAWLKDGRTCERQLARHSIECPHCGDRKIVKAIMAPRPITAPSAGVSAKSEAGKDKMVRMAEDMRHTLRELRKTVEAHCDYVGDNFAEEARRLHYDEGETRKTSRGIYGEATDSDYEALQEEGIDVARLPWIPPSDA